MLCIKAEGGGEARKVIFKDTQAILEIHITTASVHKIKTAGNEVRENGILNLIERRTAKGRERLPTRSILLYRIDCLLPDQIYIS